ncbi:FadR/GntR family transcriptional regulator [Streptomyces lancefieldiae]|uniref:FCD domain-containing protein n=1 Tax=Streptomyces lancefieldiae TaxID=3075520 RepID=A0ABU3AXG6_9ACTN|nr:FCD domain-containing protein [Streptomyces sp. DSM 40712]MDT0614887.1 FCD domain-containing protein [Streptomyces sp. DSM 40712]
MTSGRLVDPSGRRSSRNGIDPYVRERTHWNLLDADVIRWRMETGDGTQLLRDLADVRSVVEPAAAHRASLHHGDADLAALESALDAMRRAQVDSTAAAEADAAFHRALLAATGNEMLHRMDLEPGLRERDRMVHAHTDADDPVPSHRAVLDAVRDRDPARAELAMLDLLAKAAEDLDHLTTAQDGAPRP